MFCHSSLSQHLRSSLASCETWNICVQLSKGFFERGFPSEHLWHLWVLDVVHLAPCKRWNSWHSLLISRRLFRTFLPFITCDLTNHYRPSSVRCTFPLSPRLLNPHCIAASASQYSCCWLAQKPFTLAYPFLALSAKLLWSTMVDVIPLIQITWSAQHFPYCQNASNRIHPNQSQVHCVVFDSCRCASTLSNPYSQRRALEPD